MSLSKYIYICQKRLKMHAKEVIRSRTSKKNRQTMHDGQNKKGQTMIYYKTKHRKLKIKRHEHNLTPTKGNQTEP